jgi:UDP-N-acetylmuramate dehydrogenase
MQIQENISLKAYNSFAIDAKARWLAVFKSVDDLQQMNYPVSARGPLLLGGGSNMLLADDYNGLVLKNEVKGISILKEDPDYVYVSVGAGENWHSFVTYCIEKNWSGVENLSLIPGNVGAAPIQNIGAYGVELENVFYSLQAFHLKDRTVRTFTRADCEFGYRDSVFKNKWRDQFAIVSVVFQLRKHPIYHTEYGAIREELERMGVKEMSIRAISQAVINIRTSKLPDPKIIPNAGSFFKNPEVEDRKYNMLKQKFPGLVGYSLLNGKVKLAAGWMIEQCGPANGISWKGFREGDAGCHAKQALVLVNYGNAKGSEIISLANRIAASVYDKFDVKLEKEVNVI